MAPSSRLRFFDEMEVKVESTGQPETLNINLKLKNAGVAQLVER
jgi:hypothetical protein